MRNISKTAFAMLLLFLLFSTTSYSATVTPNGNAVLSVSGLTWTYGPNNNTNWETIVYGPYDVTFDFGTYNDVVLGHSDVGAFTQLEANMAAQNLATAINNYNTAHPTATLIYVDNSVGDVPSAQVPGELVPTNNVYFYTLGYEMSYPETWGVSATYPLRSRGTPASTWAVFNTSAVPIPGAVWLLGSGLIGIVGIRRKIRN